MPAVKCEDREIGSVEKFCYLGWICTADGSTEEAIEDRLGKAGALFRKMYLIFKDQTLSTKLKIRMSWHASYQHCATAARRGLSTRKPKER